MNSPSVWENNLVLVPLVLGLFGLTGVFAVWIVKKGSSMMPKPKEPAKPVPAWLWACLFLGSAIIFFGRTSPARAGAAIAVGLLFLMAMVVFLTVRTIDWALRKAVKRGGTVDELQALVAKKPTQDRVGFLGIALSNAGRKEEAAEQFRRAAEMGPHRRMHLSNLASTLCELGRPEEALETLQQALLSKPDVRITECLIHLNSATALTDLGRREEAREQYRLAEQSRDALRRSEKALLAEAFSSCRFARNAEPGEVATQEASGESPRRHGDS